MTREEAQEILSVFRQDLPHEEVPGVPEALALLEEDSELREWFESEQQFDRQFASALQGIPVPEALVDQILAGAPEPEANPSAAEEDDGSVVATKVLAFPRRRLWTVAAAAVVLTAVSLVKYFVFPPPVVFPSGNFASVKKFCDDMAYYANSRFVLGKSTRDYTVARDWLKQRESPSYEETPEVIVDFKGMGCQTFLWGEERVSLVCFKNTDGEIVHLFVVNRDAFEQLPPADELRAVQVRHKLETGGWMADDDRLYLLVGSEPNVRIGEILSQVRES